jgi:hypothetical protein
LLFALLLFLDSNDFPALVVTAGRADGVRGANLAAVRARDKVDRRQGVVRAASISPAAGMFSLGLWGHDLYPKL